MSSTLPSYESESFDFLTPDYSPEPRANEERLEYQQQAHQLPRYDSRLTGVFVHQKGGVTVVLNHQNDHTPTPIFSRRSNVEGTLLIDAPDSVLEITLKLIGSIETVSPSTGWTLVKVLDQSLTLFNSSDNMASQSPCPSSLRFSCPIPSTFKYGGKEYLLPPSYYVLLGGQGQAYYAKCTYNFSAIISKARSRRTAFLGKSHKHITFVIEYSPRLSPPRPAIKHSLLSTIRESSEEWRQFSYHLVPRSGKYDLEPLTCQLFLPSVGVFGIRDFIPFHVQILGWSTGSLAKLRSAIANDSENLPSSTKSAPQAEIHMESEPLFRIHLLRQVAINTDDGNKSAVHFSLGEAKLSPAPAIEGAISLSSPGQQGQKQENMNWEGQVHCGLEEKLAPSFNAGIIAITDFVVLELSNSHANLFQPFRHGHPVRLVSDSWRERER